MPIKNKTDYKSILSIDSIYGDNNKKFQNIEYAILFFKKSHMDYLKKFGFKNLNFYEYNCVQSSDGKILGISGFGIGAPATCILIEQLRCFGVKKILLVGIAGSFDSKSKYGDIYICKKSFVDEGTSPNYITDKIVYSSEIMDKKLENSLRKNKIEFKYAFSWTTDAVFRETKEEIEYYSKNGLNTVDMESSVAMTLQKYYGDIEVSVVFVISDKFVDGNWNGFSDKKKVKNNIKKVLESIISQTGKKLIL